MSELTPFTQVHKYTSMNLLLTHPTKLFGHKCIPLLDSDSCRNMCQAGLVNQAFVNSRYLDLCKQQHEIATMKENLPYHILNLLGSITPKHLIHQHQFVGPTDYIDRIESADIPHAVMWSIDQFSRPYLIFKVRVTSTSDKFRNPQTRKWCKKGEFVEDVLVLFQRYTDVPHKWVFSNASSLTDLFLDYACDIGSIDCTPYKSVKQILDDYQLNPGATFSNNGIQLMFSP